MNCSFHAQNIAVVTCNGCSRPLCAGCDHRIKGFPFCEDCIVEGVDILRSTSRRQPTVSGRRRTYPVVALLLSWICPGLGAAYNGQMIKALVHFGIVAGLFQMSVSTGMAIFIIGLLGMWWFFLPLDAWRSAKLIRAGVFPAAADDFILERLSSNAKLSGIVLVGVGGLFFLNSLFGKGFLIKGVLPFMLVFLGLYLIKDYVSRRGMRGTENDLGRYGASQAPSVDANERFKDGPPKSSWRN